MLTKDVVAISNYSQTVDLFSMIPQDAIDLFLSDAVSVDKPSREDYANDFRVATPDGETLEFSLKNRHRTNATCNKILSTEGYMQTLLVMEIHLCDVFNTDEQYTWSKNALEGCLAKFRHLVKTKLCFQHTESVQRVCFSNDYSCVVLAFKEHIICLSLMSLRNLWLGTKDSLHFVGISSKVFPRTTDGLNEFVGVLRASCKHQPAAEWTLSLGKDAKERVQQVALAFAMGVHPRLGADSKMKCLSQDHVDELNRQTNIFRTEWKGSLEDVVHLVKFIH
jgi:hypothetical protein